MRTRMSCLMLIERPKVTEAHGYLDDDDDGVFVVECCPLVHMTRSMSTSVSPSNCSCSFEHLSNLLVEPIHLMAIVAWNRPNHLPSAQRRDRAAALKRWCSSGEIDSKRVSGCLFGRTFRAHTPAPATTLCATHFPA